MYCPTCVCLQRIPLRGPLIAAKDSRPYENVQQRISACKESAVRRVNPIRTLVLDMDETLIGQFPVRSYRTTPNVFSVMRGAMVVGFRPFLREFLIFARSNFELVLWTAGMLSYAREVIRHMEREFGMCPLFDHVIARDSRWYEGPYHYKKSLYDLGRKVDTDVLLFENSPYVGKPSKNVVLVSDFHGSLINTGLEKNNVSYPACPESTLKLRSAYSVTTDYCPRKQDAGPTYDYPARIPWHKDCTLQHGIELLQNWNATSIEENVGTFLQKQAAKENACSGRERLNCSEKTLWVPQSNLKGPPLRLLPCSLNQEQQGSGQMHPSTSGKQALSKL